MNKVNSQLDWVAAYPKSGSTWVRLMLKSYLPAVADYSDSPMPFFQACCAMPCTTLEPWQEVAIRGAALYHIAIMANNVQSLIKTHHVFGTLAGVPLFAPAWTRKVIYVIRDPRDVACSMAYHFQQTHEEAVEFMADNSQLGDLEDGKMHHVLTTWSQHVKSWTTQKVIPTVIVKYEDLHADCYAEMSEVVEFMGWDLNEDRLRAAIAVNTFDKLRALEEKQGFIEAKPHGPFFRRGQVGAWRDELSEELVEKIEREHGEQMLAVGYEPELVEVAA